MPLLAIWLWPYKDPPPVVVRRLSASASITASDLRRSRKNRKTKQTVKKRFGLSNLKKGKRMKSHLVVVVLVVLALAVPATMLAQQNSKAEKEIRAWIEETRLVNLKGGPEAVAFTDKHAADDVVRIPPNGALVSKSDILNGFKSGGLKVEKWDIKIDQIRVYGKWAIVTGTDASTWTLNGERINTATRWSRVFRKEDGIWKGMLFQNTKLPAQ